MFNGIDTKEIKDSENLNSLILACENTGSISVCMEY